jgi:hypothetical protein
VATIGIIVCEYWRPTLLRLSESIECQQQLWKVNKDAEQIGATVISEDARNAIGEADPII